MDPAMDPDGALRQLRGLIAHCLHDADHDPAIGSAPTSFQWMRDAREALQRVQDLDEWLSTGGRLPADWSH
jgi:hypothetical protein